MRTIGTNAPWSEDDDNELYRLVTTSAPWGEICETFGRTLWACKTRFGIVRNRLGAGPTAEDLFAKAMGDQRYTDHPRALPPQEVPLRKRDYGANHMTMAGVANYAAF